MIKDLLGIAASIAADIAVGRAEKRHPHARLLYFLAMLVACLIAAYYLVQAGAGP